MLNSKTKYALVTAVIRIKINPICQKGHNLNNFYETKDFREVMDVGHDLHGRFFSYLFILMEYRMKIIE